MILSLHSINFYGIAIEPTETIQCAILRFNRTDEGFLLQDRHLVLTAVIIE